MSPDDWRLFIAIFLAKVWPAVIVGALIVWGDPIWFNLIKPALQKRGLLRPRK